MLTKTLLSLEPAVKYEMQACFAMVQKGKLREKKPERIRRGIDEEQSGKARSKKPKGVNK